MNKTELFEEARMKGGLEGVKGFLEKEGSDIVMNDKKRPIHVAVEKGFIDIFKLLIEMKCDIECEDYQKKRPIHVAVEKGLIDIVKLLIEMKCDIECEDYQKRRSIHYGCANGYIDIVQLLIEKKCDNNCEDRSNCTPIYWACVNGYSDIVELLRKEYGNGKIEENKRFIISDSMKLICRSDCCHTDFCRESFLTCLKNKQNLTKVDEGSFGIVYRLTESGTNRHFGLKSIDIEAATKMQTTDSKAVKNIEQYINICLDRLRHENIVTFFGAIEIDNQLNILMEYMEGGSLKEYIDKSKSERTSNWKDYYRKVFEITKQILEGVVFLHSNRIIHRDIKPGNILLDREKERIKLSDFGMSRFCVDPWFNGFHDAFSGYPLRVIKIQYSTSIRSSCGTLGYIAPEIRKNEDYTFAVDIWSVGATLRHMLTGKVPPEFSYDLKIKNSDDLYWLMNQMVNINPESRLLAIEAVNDKRFYLRFGSISNRNVLFPFRNYYRM